MTSIFESSWLTTVGALQDAAGHPEGERPASARVLVSQLSRAND